MSAISAGFARGMIELRQGFAVIASYVFFPTIAVFVMYLLRGQTVAGEPDVSIGAYAIPGIVSMNVLFTGLMGIASNLMTDRDDGTILRVQSIPRGIVGYFVGKIVSQSALTIVTFAVVLGFATLLFDSFAVDASGVATLLWTVPLGLTAMLPVGIALGCLVRHPRQLSFLSLLLMGLTAISGVFYPLALQSPVLQIVGQIFPLYWLGLGIRSAMLPDSVAAMEIGQSWRTLETVAVLGAWSAVATLLALYALRRVSDRTSGRSKRAVTRETSS